MPTMTEETNTRAVPVQEQEAPAVQGQLGMNDLAILVQAVDIAAKAGAYAGNDMAIIGTSRNNVAAFVKANMPAPAEPTETEEAPLSAEAE